MLLALAPGLRVVRRGLDHLQVGLYDERRVVLPRGSATAHVLDRIGQRQPVDLDLPGVAATVAQLLDAGCAVSLSAGQSDRSRPAAQPAGRRGAARVAVVGEVGPDPVPLLTAAGFGAVLRGADQALRADVALLLSRGEPDRERLDPWLRSRLPHLVLRVVDGGVVLGPFVRPGQSACLRCVDAHHATPGPRPPGRAHPLRRGVAAPAERRQRRPRAAAGLAGPRLGRA